MNLLEKYNELEKKLDNLINSFKFSPDNNLKLERIFCLLNLLGNPQESFSTIHIGGTSGKGSTSSYLAKIMQNDGYKTGLFLSPYLQVINEVCLIGSYPVTTSDLLDMYNIIEPTFIEVAKKTKFGRPSYFEVKLALALMLFKKNNIDIAIIEVGLGGSLDATNILHPEVSVLVSVGLDHTEILGDTIEEIATEKVGIIKNNGVVVCGFSSDFTRKIARKKAKEKKAKILFINQDFSYIYKNGKASIITNYFSGKNINLLINANHQAHNATCAVATYGEFKIKDKSPISRTSVVKGILQTKISGRTEIIQRNPTVILDGAHNPDKLKAFFNNLKDFTDNPILIFAIKKGRDVNSLIYPMLGNINAKKIIVTSFYDKGIWEALPSEQLMTQIKKSCNNSINIISINDPITAIKTSLLVANYDDVIAVTGSMFLVGDIRNYWYPKLQLLNQIEYRSKLGNNY